MTIKRNGHFIETSCILEILSF